MKNKSLNLVIASVLLAVFLVSFASALTLNPSSLTFDDNDSRTITVTSSESSIDYNLTFTVGSIDFEVSGNKTLDSNNQTTLTITPQDDIKDLDFLEEYTDSFSVWDSSETQSVTVKVSNSDFCEYEDFGYLNIDISDWRIVTGYGDDDEWFPLDEIEIEIEIENAGSYDLENVEIEWGLYDEENNQWMFEVDDEDEFDLDEDDDETITFTFTLDKSIDLDDFEDLLNSGIVVLYARATGTVDDSSSSHDNEKTCVSDKENFEIIVEKDFVVLKDVEISESVSCDSDLQISGEVWNIGSKDQDDIEVKIVIPGLDIEEYVEIEELEKDFEKEEFSLTLELPEDVEAGSYVVKFYVLDEDGDTYEADNDDELSSFSKTITITGDCAAPKVSVSAVLQSGGKSGEELVVKATLTNTGSKESQYVLNVAGYSEWADSAELSQDAVTLKAGESGEVLVTLDVKKNVEGEKLFSLEILSDGKLIASQPVSVTVEKSSLFGGITGFAINKDNWHIWGIGFLNLILVIIIIVVAIRIARRK